MLKATTVAVGLAMASLAGADELPGMGESDSPWQVDVTYENHTVRRENAGLAKFRNTLQAEFDKKAGDGWTVHGIMRGSWDGVYRMNSSEYGKNAGGPIMLESSLGYLLPPAANMPTAVPHGGGIANNASGPPGMPSALIWLTIRMMGCAFLETAGITQMVASPSAYQPVPVTTTAAAAVISAVMATRS